MFIPVTEEAVVSVETSFRTPKPTQGQEAIYRKRLPSMLRKRIKRKSTPSLRQEMQVVTYSYIRCTPTVDVSDVPLLLSVHIFGRLTHAPLSSLQINIPALSLHPFLPRNIIRLL